MQRRKQLHRAGRQPAQQLFVERRIVVPRRRAGTEQRQPESGRRSHPRQAPRQRFQAGIIGKIGAELACQIALRKSVADRSHRALLLMPAYHLAEARLHHHRRVGAQRRLDPLRPQHGLGGVVAHAEPVRLAQRRLHVVPLRGGQCIPLHAADGVENQLPARRQRIAPDHVGHGSRRAELARRPRGPRCRIGVVARDGFRGRGRIEQHDRSLPGAAGQQFAACVDQLRRLCRERRHAMAAESAQIARCQPGEFKPLPRQQRRQQMRKQQVAEIVAIEGAEQDRRNTRVHRLRSLDEKGVNIMRIIFSHVARFRTTFAKKPTHPPDETHPAFLLHPDRAHRRPGHLQLHAVEDAGAAAVRRLAQRHAGGNRLDRHGLDDSRHPGQLPRRRTVRLSGPSGACCWPRWSCSPPRPSSIW